ncbi:MAG TPA: serine--tRNA ligase [Candidatus Paceibacterota bacterium]|jgi:seryl-tRNA synthetase
MLDIKFIRENKDLVKAGARKKHVDIDLDALIVLDDKRKALTASFEAKRAEQNAVSAKLPSADAETKAALLESMKKVKTDMQADEEALKEMMKEWQAMMLRVPNMPDISVPDGVSDADNKEVHTWGEKTQFSFQPKDHIELMTKLDLLDLEKGTETAGFRGYYLKNDAVTMNFGLWQFVLDRFVKKGYKPMMVPSLVRKQPLYGTGYLPQGEEDLYKTQDGDYLTGTAEVATMSYFADKVIDKSELPMKIIAFSTCFRREAGSHSKDTKGIIRVHEFYKLEQVILCEASHEESVKHHEELRRNSEEILEALKLPYHTVVNCGGDIGLGQVKKYDLEAWVPSQNTYRETHSCSYFHDFQTRRLNIRYRDTDGKLKFAHSLNNTALAGPRILVPIIENYQQEDGSVKVPDILKPYLGKDVITK